MQPVLNYKEFGQGPPLVILHGLFGMLDNWQTIAKKLAEDYTVFVVDQRNHGRSFHKSPHTYEELAKDLADFLEEKWIFKTHLLGHSMGGKTAMKFAMDYPDNVDHLIVADIAPKRYEGNHQLIFDALFSIDIAHLESRKRADELLSQKIKNPAIKQFLLKNLSRNKTGGFRWKMNLPVLKEYYGQILSACISEEEIFEGKTLFLKAERSSYITTEDEEIIRTHFPNAIIESIPNVGHWLHAEAPDAVVKRILHFLAQ